MLASVIVSANLVLTPVESLDNVNELKPSTPDVTRIYFIRHGESAFNIANEKGIKYTSGKGYTVPLTEKGKEQAIDLSKKLVKKLPIDQIYEIHSSTALRAKDTAQYVFEGLQQHHNIQIGRQYENFCEVGKGNCEGKPKDEYFNTQLKNWEKLSAYEKYHTPKVSDGESYSEVAKKALVDLIQIAEESSGKTIFIVSHYETMNSIAIELSNRVSELSKEPFTTLPLVPFGNCDMMMVEIENNIGQATVQMYIQNKS